MGSGLTRRHLLASALAAPLAAGAARPARAEGLALTLAGGSPGGLWSLIGLGLDRALRRAAPGSSVTYQTSGGGYANIRLLSEGRVDMGLVHDAEAAQAAAGAPPFPAPVPSLRALAVMYDFSALQPLVSAAFAEAHGIESFADLRAARPPLRIALNRPGNITRDLAIAVLEAHGITLADIEAWGGRVLTGGSREGADLMRNRQADMTMNAPFVGHSSITEVARAIDVRLLPVAPEALAEVRARMGIGQTVVPAAAYDFLDADLQVPALAAMIAVDAAMAEARARALVEAILAELDALRGVHAAMGALDREMLVAQDAIPFHPGARAAFEAAGLL
jgi:hypothetical protein